LNPTVRLVGWVQVRHRFVKANAWVDDNLIEMGLVLGVRGMTIGSLEPGPSRRREESVASDGSDAAWTPTRMAPYLFNHGPCLHWSRSHGETQVLERWVGGR
jgi:hypothetical protein